MDYCEDCQHVSKKLLTPIYVCDEDELRLGVSTPTAGLVVGVSGLLINERGEKVPFTVSVAPTSDRVETVVQNNIGTGWLTHCQAHLISGSIGSRAVYVNARIVRNSGTPATPVHTLLSGYLGNSMQPSHPFGYHEWPTEGQGNLRSITGTNPAAGAEISETVPAGARWRIIAIEATFVASAAVANRRVSLRLDDGANEYYKVEGNADVTAGQTRVFTMWSTGLPSSGNNVTFYLPLPISLLMPAGHRIRTITSGLDVGDDWGAPQLYVEEWLTT